MRFAMGPQTRWTSWTVKGSDQSIEKMFEILQSNLPDGWSRMPDLPVLPGWPMRVESRRYAYRPTPPKDSINVSIDWIGDSGVRGRGVIFLDPPDPADPLNRSSAWIPVLRFLDDGIAPAARQAGAQFRYPTAEEEFFSDLPFGVGQRLRDFSKAARKGLPLDGAEEKLWHAFVIGAFRSEVRVDSGGLIEWLVADGWPRESASGLNEQFLDQSLLLDRFVGEGSAA